MLKTQKVIINNFRLSIPDLDNIESEDLSIINSNNIKSTNMMTIFILNKFTKKYKMIRFLQKNMICYEHFIKDNEYDTFIYYDYFVQIHNNIVDYDYMFCNMNSSYQYIKRKYKSSINNNIAVILHGSLKSINNFKIIQTKILAILKKMFYNFNFHFLFFINNDIFEFNNVTLEYDMCISLENITDNNKFLFYIFYIFVNFYKSVNIISFTKLIFINMNYSYLNLENLEEIDIHKNYFIDELNRLCILNEKQFFELSLLNHIYYSSDFEVYNFNNFLSNYPTLCLHNIDNCGTIKIN